jgi:hypothetical protein
MAKGNRSTSRGSGTKDINQIAYETMLQATGQKAKTGVPVKRSSGVSLRGLARKA